MEERCKGREGERSGVRRRWREKWKGGEVNELGEEGGEGNVHMLLKRAYL